MGFQSPAANAAWIEDQSYQYEVWQDVNRDLATYYGAKNGLLDVPDRVTMLLDPDGLSAWNIVGQHWGSPRPSALRLQSAHGDGDNAAP